MLSLRRRKTPLHQVKEITLGGLGENVILYYICQNYIEIGANFKQSSTKVSIDRFLEVRMLYPEKDESYMRTTEKNIQFHEDKISTFVCK